MNLKKIIRKDADGNSMSFEFDVPKANVPPVDSIPNYDHPGEPKGSDTVPAWLTPGENVVNAEASRIPGNQQIIDYMNNQGRAIQAQQGGSIPTYADSGGPVYAAKGTKPAPDTSWVDEILDALRFVESGEITDPSKLISPAGAEGFYQIMPANFGELTEKDEAGNVIKTYKGKGAAGYDTPVITREEAYDPEKARAWAKAYLTNMQLAHPEWSPADVLRAYNWGPGNMKQFMREDIDWAEVPTEAKEYTDKVFKHYKKLTGEDFYDTTSNAPELAGLRGAIPVPGEIDIPSGDLSMADLTIPDYPVDSSVEIDSDGPGQNLKIGPGGVPDMPMNFMGSANPRRGYESGEDYLNRWGIPLDPRSVFSTRVSSSPAIGQIYEGAPPVFGMDSLYQTYPKDITPDHYPTQEQFIKGPGVPPQAEVDPTGFMERRVAENEALVNRENMLNQMADYWDPAGEFGEYVPPMLTPVIEGPDAELPANSLSERDFFKAAQAVGLPTNEDTYSKLANLINNEKISLEEAAQRLSEPLRVREAEQALVNSQGFNPQEPTLLESLYKNKPLYSLIDNEIDKIQSSNAIEHDVRVPTLDMEKYGDLLTSPPYTEDYQGVPFTEHMSDLHEAVKEKFESGDNTSSIQALMGPNNISTGGKELKETKKKAEEFRAAEEKAAKQAGMTTEELKQDRLDKLQKQFADTSSNQGDNNADAEVDAQVLEDTYRKAMEAGDDFYKKAGTRKYDNTGYGSENQVAGFFKDLLGDIFDVKELKRAAVMYLGGRLLGYSHATAGNFAVKNMLTRMQTQETTRAANIKEWMGSYTPESLQLYKETGDLSVLVPIGASVHRQGVYQDWYGRGKNGKPIKITVEKVHVGTGDKKQVKWIGPDGKEYRKEDFSLEESDYPKSDAYLEKNKTYKESMVKLINDIRLKKGRRGEKEGGGWNYATDVTPELAAEHAVTWARENNIDLSRLGDIVNMAMLDMINQSPSERADGRKPEYITGYLNSAIIKDAGGQPELFQIDPGNPAAGGVNAKEFAKMQRNIGHLLLQSGQSDSLTDISNYINTYAELWNGTATYEGKSHPENLSDADRKKWEGKGLKDTTPFFEWLQNEIALDQKELMNRN